MNFTFPNLRPCLGVLCTALAVAPVLLAQPAAAKDTAAIIPHKINRARAVYVRTGAVSDTLNSDSQLEGLTNSLNRGVTVNDLIDQSSGAAATDLQSLVGSLNTLEPGLGDSLANANIFSDYSIQQQIVLVAYEYGIFKNLNFGARMPVVRKDIKNEFRVESTVNGQRIRELLAGSGNEALEEGINKFIDSTGNFDTEFFKQSIFTGKGYKPPRNFTQTDLGDLEFGVKWRYLKTRHFTNSLTWGWRAPTGSVTPIDDPFNKGVGKGTWGTALKFHQDIWFTDWLVFGTLGKVTYNLPDTRDRAVPKDEDDSLPSLLPSANQVHAIKRQRAMELDGEIALEGIFLQQLISAWAAIQYTNKGVDSYTGGPSELRPDLLAENSDYTATNGEVGAQFSTINWYRQKKFAVPMQVGLLYNAVLSGRNTPDISYARMDVKLYF